MLKIALRLTVYAWESTQATPYWVYSWLENYAKARMFDSMMELGKQLNEGSLQH